MIRTNDIVWIFVLTTLMGPSVFAHSSQICFSGHCFDGGQIPGKTPPKQTDTNSEIEMRREHNRILENLAGIEAITYNLNGFELELNRLNPQQFRGSEQAGNGSVLLILSTLRLKMANRFWDETHLKDYPS